MASFYHALLVFSGFVAVLFATMSDAVPHKFHSTSSHAATPQADADLVTNLPGMPAGATFKYVPQAISSPSLSLSAPPKNKTRSAASCFTHTYIPKESIFLGFAYPLRPAVASSACAPCTPGSRLPLCVPCFGSFFHENTVAVNCVTPTCTHTCTH